MKIKPIEAIIKNKKTIQIRVDEEGVQWLGDGCAVYPLHSFPKLDEDTIFRFLDVPKDKQNKFTYSEGEFPIGFPLRDNMPGEKLLKRSEIRIVANGVKLLPLYTDSGMIFINERYLAPFADEENGFELYERKGIGQTLIAVKTGFLLAGLIAPMQFNNEKELCAICAQLAAKPYVETEEDGAQVQMERDEGK